MYCIQRLGNWGCSDNGELHLKPNASTDINEYLLVEQCGNHTSCVHSYRHNKNILVAICCLSHHLCVLLWKLIGSDRWTLSKSPSWTAHSVSKQTQCYTCVVYLIPSEHSKICGDLVCVNIVVLHFTHLAKWNNNSCQPIVIFYKASGSFIAP